MEAVSLSPLLPSSIFSSSKPFSLNFSHVVSLCPIPRYSSAALATAPPPPQRSIVGKTRASSAVSGRRTLSEGWDLSTTVAGSSTMPKLEELDPTNMLLRQRIVFLGSQVDIETADLIISQLLFLDAEDQKTDIKLFINSPGGSITAGMGIYDAMKFCKADVSTVCLGIAASMGAFILAGGTKGKRFCMPNSKVMIHQPHGTAGGRAIEFALRLREMGYQKLKVAKTLSRITGKSEQQILKDSRKDFFMNAWEAKEYGLVDAVIDDGKPGLVAPIVDSSPPPRSQVWYLWQTDNVEEMPSELKLSRSSHQNGRGNEEEGSGNEEKGSEKAKETQAPV